MALAFLFVPALVAIVALAWHWRPRPTRVVAEAATAPAAPTISGTVDPLAELDELLVALEGATVRIDGADELDESAVHELEQLAARLEAAAASLERVA